MQTRPAVYLTILLSALFLGPAVAGPPTAIPDEKIPHVAVPRAPKAPTIDGVIAPDEWGVSAVLSGVVNQATNELLPRPTHYLLMWDEQHLYIACRTWVWPGEKPRVGGRTPRSATHRDVGLELVVTPRGANVPEGRPEIAYKCNINVLGYTGMLYRLSLGQMLQDWLPEFQVATRLTDPGTAPKGGRWLEMEVAGDLEDFELTGPNRPGDMWGLMLGFNRLGISFQRVPANSGYFDPARHSTIKLVDGQPVAQIWMDQFPGVCDGRAKVRLRVINPTQEPVKAACLAEYDELEQKGRGKNARITERDLLKEHKVLTVAPGETAELVVDRKFPRELGKNRGSQWFQVKWQDQELLRYFSFFRVGYPAHYMAPKPQKTLFPLEVKFDPLNYRLYVESDAYYQPEPEKVTALRYRLFPNDNENKTIVRGTITESVTNYYRATLDLPEIEPGTYTLEASLLLGDDKQIGPVTKQVSKLDEAKEFAAWWGKQLGNTEQVIYPFKAIERTENRISPWGRTYELGALGLPRRIVSQSQPVTAAAARIVITSGEKRTELVASGAPRITQTKDWRVRFEDEAEAGPLRFSSKGWVEQDGLVYIEMTYDSQDGKPLRVDELRLEFPLLADQAEVLACVGPGSNFSARTTRILPATEGELWNTLETGLGGSRMTVGSFYPCVWLGSERRGLLWWGDSDKGWFPVDEVPAHRVVRRGDAVVLINQIIGKEVTLKGPRTIAFSYMASPFRPLVKGWRTACQSRDGTFYGPHKRRTDPKTGRLVNAWWCITPPTRHKQEWGELWADYKKHADKHVRQVRPTDPDRARNGAYVHNSIPLIGYKQSIEQSVFRYFQFSWGSDRMPCFVKTHNDYILHLLNRAFGEGGLRTVYWDLFFPSVTEAPHVGVGYVLPDGRVQPGYFGLNLRRFMMRLYALNVEHGLAPGGNVAHATNAPFLVASPWVDAILDGEFHIVQKTSRFDWVEGWPVDRMRALSCTHNFGYAVSWMDRITFKDERGIRIRRAHHDYIRLFDSWSTHNYEILPQSMLDWGMNREEVVYVPFWRNPYVTCEDPEVLVSLWRLPDRVMLEVFNHGKEKARDVTLTIDLDKLGLVPKRPWQDFVRLTALDDRPEAQGVHQRELEDASWRKRPKLDFHGRKILVPNVLPRRARFLNLRRY